MRSSGGGAMEAQPHLFGARPHQYRQGHAVLNGEDPPSWMPEMAHDKTYPYSLEEWARDVRRWQFSTKVSIERQGPKLSLAIGGAARVIVDDLPEELLASGSIVDFGDGKGLVHRTGVELVFRAIFLRFPTDKEALMLRVGIEFFNFTPRRDELLPAIFLRFDVMLDRANTLAELGISFPFRSWMLLSLLRLPGKKWAEYLKDMGHKFPRTQEQYQLMQSEIVRERTLIENVHNLHETPKPAGNAHAGLYFSDNSLNPIPLFLALGGQAASNLVTDIGHIGAVSKDTD
jgi:hypothetical protein